MNVEQGFGLQDFGGIVRRRLPIMVGVALAFFLASLLLASWLPNKFESYTTLLIEPQVISKRLIETGVEKSDLNQRLHLMTMQILSRNRLSKVIDDLGLYPEESKHMTREEVIELMRGFIRVEPVLPELEQAGVRRSSNVETEINTFRLFFLDESAEVAAAVVNRLANDFIEEHIKERVQVSGETSEFIESELSRLQSRIQEVEARIAQVKSENPGRLPDEFDANQRLLERQLDNLRQVQREQAEAQSDEAFYRQQSMVAVESGGAGRAETDPASRLAQLELMLSTYRSRGFTEKHPDIVATQIEIDQLRTTASSSGGRPLSQAQQNAEAERRRAALRFAAAQDAIQKTTAQIDDTQKRLAETPRVAEQLGALTREYEHLGTSLLEYSNKRLEAGVAANMERRQKGEQFKVLETGFPAPEPRSPNRLVIVIVGLMLGLAVGAGLGILLESADGSFHLPRDLQAALRIPVLAAIPSIVLDADLAAQRRRRARLAFATGALTMMTLVLSAGGYWYVNVLKPGRKQIPEAALSRASGSSAVPAQPTSPGMPPAAAGSRAEQGR